MNAGVSQHSALSTQRSALVCAGLLALAGMLALGGCRDTSRGPLGAAGLSFTSAPAYTTVAGTFSAAALAAAQRAVVNPQSALRNPQSAQHSALNAATLAVEAWGTNGSRIIGTVDAATGRFTVALPASATVRYLLLFSDDGFAARVFTLRFPQRGTRGVPIAATDTLDGSLIPAAAGVAVDLGSLSTGSIPITNRQNGAAAGTNANVFFPAANPLDSFDGDGDGVPDVEDADAAWALNPLDPDDDGLPIKLDADWDNDGLANAADPDADGDGANDLTADFDRDGNGHNDVKDANFDGVPDWLDADSDGVPDGVTPGSEIADTDSDGIPDTVDVDADHDGAVDNGGALTFTGLVLLVGTTDYTTGGTVAAVEAAVADRTTTTRARTENLDIIQSDAVLRAGPDFAYVINRFGFNNVQVLDPRAGFRTVRQFSVGNVAGEAATNTNPQDLVVISPTKAYLSLYEAQTKHLLIVNPQTGAHTGSIDLSAFVDTAGGVDRLRPADLLLAGGHCYVLCQNIKSDFSVYGAGRVVAVDTATDQPVDLDPTTEGVNGLDLPAPLRNPVAAHYDAARNKLWVLAGASGPVFSVPFDGDPNTTIDSGLVEFDLATGAATVLFDNGFDANAPDAATRSVSATSEQYEVFEGMAAAPNGHLYLNVSVSFSSYRIVAVDPVARTVVNAAVATLSAFVPDLVIDQQGFLYVADRSATAPAIRVFDTQAGDAARGAVAMDVPPASLAVFPGDGR